jgi:hypothetical protein
MHIPKTGGTTVNSFLRKNLDDPSDFVNPNVEDFVRNEVSFPPSLKVFSGHFSGFFPLILGSWPRLVTILRNPLTRSLSHINHVQRDPRHALHLRARGLNVASYCADPLLRKTIENFQARQVASLAFAVALLEPPGRKIQANPLSAGVELENALFSLDAGVDLTNVSIDTLSCFDVVGVTEDLQSSLLVIADEFGFSDGTIPIAENVAFEDQPKATALSQSDIEILRDLTSIDQQLWSTAKNKLMEDCQSRGIPHNLGG